MPLAEPFHLVPHRLYLSLCVCFLLFVPFVVNSPAAEPTYWQDIRPLLRKHCTACHNEKNVPEVEVSGGLALDRFDAFKPGVKKQLVSPGKGSGSLLIKVLLHKDKDRRMPQDAPPLPEETVAVFRRWIDAGAREGKRPDSETIASTTAPARTRKLDVILKTDAIPPKDVLGPGAPAKLELALKAGPLAPIAAVAFSRDGKFLATGSYGLVTIWDLAMVRPVKTLTNILGAVNDLRFSPDGKLLAVAGGQPSAKGDLRLFEVGSWKLHANLGGHADVVSGTAFSPDGKLLASASFDKTVRVWDIAGPKLLHTLTGHSDFVYAVAFGPGGKWLVSASKDRTVKKIDTATGKSLLTLSGMDREIIAVAVSPDGKQIVCSGGDPTLFWWNASTGERTRRQGGHGIAVHELGFSKDGQTAFSAGADRTVRLWRGSDGAAVKSFSVGSIAYAAAVSPDGKRIVAGSFDGMVRMWDAASGRLLLTFLSLPPKEQMHNWLALTPEGYANGSDGLAMLGQWRMSGKMVAGEKVWKAVRRAEMAAKAGRGQKVVPPEFGK